MIAQLHEDDLALIALGHHATSHLYAVFGVLAIFKTSVFLVEVDDVMRIGKRMTVRVLARRDKRLALGMAHQDRIVFGCFRCCVLSGVLAHRSPFNF